MNYNGIISGEEILNMSKKNKEHIFNNYLIAVRNVIIKDNNLKYCDGVFYEDNLFDFQLFCLSKRTMIINDKLYLRRIRKGSITTEADQYIKFMSYSVILKEADDFVTSRNIEGQDYYLLTFVKSILSSWKKMKQKDRNRINVFNYLKEYKWLFKKYNYINSKAIKAFTINPYLYLLIDKVTK